MCTHCVGPDSRFPSHEGFVYAAIFPGSQARSSEAVPTTTKLLVAILQCGGPQQQQRVRCGRVCGIARGMLCATLRQHGRTSRGHVHTHKPAKSAAHPTGMLVSPHPPEGGHHTHVRQHQPRLPQTYYAFRTTAHSPEHHHPGRVCAHTHTHTTTSMCARMYVSVCASDRERERERERERLRARATHTQARAGAPSSACTHMCG